MYKNRDFRIFFIFFLYFGFGRRFGVYFGVYFGAQRGFVFCRGRTNSQNYFASSPTHPDCSIMLWNEFWGWGFAQIWRRFFLCFFLAFIFHREEIITPIFGTVICTDFGALIYAQIFEQIFCADFVRRFLRRSFVRNAHILAQIFRIFFFDVLALQKYY